MMPFGVSEKFLRTSWVQLGFVHLACAESLNPHADGISNADGISKLDFGALRETCSHNVLGDVARHVRALNDPPLSDPCR